MKKSRYTDSQILNILKQTENGCKVPDLCREYGMSSATFYKWRAKYGGMDVSLMARMKELEAESRQLKKSTQNPKCRPKSSRRYWEKSNKAISSPRDGQNGC